MIKQLAAVALFATVGFLPSPVFADDAQLSAAVKGEFINQHGVPATVAVTSSNGNVVLTGKVYSAFDKQRAIEVAEHVPGVSTVRSEIVVDNTQREDDDIKIDVKRALANDVTVESWQTQVFIDAGEVTLTGQVDSQVEKMVAERVAGRVAGVTRVRNEIVVLPTGPRTDKEVLTDIEAKMAWDPVLDEELLFVSVNRGRALIVGHVGTEDEKARAIAAANVEGVTAVDADTVEVARFATDNIRTMSKVNAVGGGAASTSPQRTAPVEEQASASLLPTRWK